VQLRLSLPHDEELALELEDGRTLAQQLWQMGAGGADRGGMALSVAITDAFVEDFTVEVREQDLDALRLALGRLGSAMRLTRGLVALQSAIAA
jgi:hypothetical protein